MSSSTPVDPTTSGEGAILRDAFTPVPGYLDAATVGLPPRATVTAMTAAIGDWATGKADIAAYDAAVTTARDAYARLVGVPTPWVAIGAQVSALMSAVACAVPDGAHVVVRATDFTSVIFPFMVHRDRDVEVEQVELDDLATAIRPGTWAVVFSLVQSADGRLADVASIAKAAREHGALTVVDTTQATGWYPVQADDFDITVCGAYKWLASPRGTAFLTIRPDLLASVRPIAAGWYAGESVWDSIYGPEMTLAHDARRLDISPAWLDWVGTAPAVSLFADADRNTLATGVRLASRVRAELGMPETGVPVISLADPDGTLAQRLQAAGARFATRGGRLRLAFHVWNDDEDATTAIAAITGQA